MTEKPLVIFGASDFAQIAHFYFTQDSPRSVAAFCVNQEFLAGSSFDGKPLAAFETIEKAYPPENFDMFIAIGYHHLNADRAQKYEEAKRKGYRMASYVCSRSVIWPGTKIGENCFILENQTIQPFVEIGNNVVLWSGNHIGHHSRVDDHAFVTSHVVISSHVRIGTFSFLGINSSVGNGVKLASRTVLGAGALVLHDSAEGAVYGEHESRLSRIPSDKLEFFGFGSRDA